MKRALMYASVASMIQQFNMENIRLLLELGYEVDVVCNMEYGSTITSEKIDAMKRELEAMGVRVYHVPVPRKISAVGEILKSYRATRKLIRAHAYDLIHCHSPIGGLVCRIANRLSGRYGQAKMIYTAHGFHFYRGAPKTNWLLFYPVEWLCARYTDVLITINQEDYALAQSRMKAKQVTYVPGVGVNLSQYKYKPIQKETVRDVLDIGDNNDVIFLSVGELSARKNHEVVIRALAGLTNSRWHYLICGLGPLKEHLQQVIAELKLESRVTLLGFRNDIAEIMSISDIYVFPSFQEGLPLALMEAMASGLPVACSRIRGNTDLIDDEGGTLFDPACVDECRAAIQKCMSMTCAGAHNAEKIREFGSNAVNSYMKAIYSNN